MTLYTFDRDSAGKSACNGNCAVNWPPLMAPADAQPMGKWSVVTRDDGSQVDVQLDSNFNVVGGESDGNEDEGSGADD